MCPLLTSLIGNVPFKPYPIGCQLCVLGLVAFLQGCALSVPAGVKPVAGFDVNQYLGRWYEIARLDNRFQRGLEQVTATYSLREDGSICVENTGWHSQTGQQKTVVGKAKFVSAKQIGHLKVSFWGPFYGSYVIFHLEADYSVAMVCGSNRNYCWILARNPVLSTGDIARYREIARENGFAVEDLIYAPSIVPVSNIVDH
ncbi:MAG: hypothetical protein RL012_126 [Bacteroidota bacterium]|jgi:apolipoprotein D and lipocalin family protein